MYLKKLELENIEEIKKIIDEVFSKEPWNDEWLDKNQFNQYILDLIGNANSLSLGLYDNDTLIGVSLGRIKHWYTGNEYWIDDLGVLTEKQGNGVGSHFIKLIEEYIKLNGMNKIVLFSERDIPAYYFYKKNEFEEEKERVFFTKTIK